MKFNEWFLGTSRFIHFTQDSFLLSSDYHTTRILHCNFFTQCICFHMTWCIFICLSNDSFFLEFFHIIYLTHNFHMGFSHIWFLFFSPSFFTQFCKIISSLVIFFQIMFLTCHLFSCFFKYFIFN